MKCPQLFTVAALVAIMAVTGCKKDDPEPPATPCTYTVGGWSAWSNGLRTRSVSAQPAGCTGTAPANTDTHYCVTLNEGWLRVSNYSTNPYRITITGPTSVQPFNLNGGYMQDSIPVDVGTYGIHALQLSGYVFEASEFTTSKAVARCNVAQWSFP